MTGTRTVTRHAPGKLFIVGEYAVVQPGHPAILAAVDRQVSVTASAAHSGGADVVIDSDLCPGEARLRRGDGGLAALGADDEQRVRDGLTHVVSAIETVEGLMAEQGLSAPPVHLSISSRLHHEGTKLGLGSSGAVTVASVSAVAAYYGMELSHEDRFRLAMLATARLDARSSGGDLAASVWGGWIEYRAPDRAAVLDLVQRRGIEESLRTPWPGFGIRRLPSPRGLAVEVGWTGRPASTASLVGSLGRRAWQGSASQRSFLERSDTCVRASVDALERGDGPELLRQVRGARRMLAELDEEVRLGIFTPTLTALCDAAETAGGAGKPSGAGGGDCGIALLDATAEDATVHEQIAHLRKGWAAAGVLPVPIHLQSTKGSAA
ncbi:phosphomevalonate kinase [Streptomyces sp. NBC_00193]|uniref:phosphomevalonate kinase n=1 Tax=unclassified Streptomyces TaxID=2593676 RepID=UPI002252767D|nr:MULTISPECIES: phosphomevalonate kinase [unclassified Streptomyces]MCX5127179.1 phosphomevalonate kinase [Streptomyces sp. NBC_00347]MCX5295388.1 phosphomevalonate kinase [Streptomyces sp. NBC_00193]